MDKEDLPEEDADATMRHRPSDMGWEEFRRLMKKQRRGKGKNKGKKGEKTNTKTDQSRAATSILKNETRVLPPWLKDQNRQEGLLRPRVSSKR